MGNLPYRLDKHDDMPKRSGAEGGETGAESDAGSATAEDRSSARRKRLETAQNQPRIDAGENSTTGGERGGETLISEWGGYPGGAQG